MGGFLDEQSNAQFCTAFDVKIYLDDKKQLISNRVLLPIPPLVLTQPSKPYCFVGVIR